MGSHRPRNHAVGDVAPPGSPSSIPPARSAVLPPLELLKTIGDDTRYAIYQAIAEAPEPMSTAALSERIGLHANTIRPHLDRMREAGLLIREVAPDGGVGRPGHRYRVVDAPSVLGKLSGPISGPIAAPPGAAVDGIVTPDDERHPDDRVVDGVDVRADDQHDARHIDRHEHGLDMLLVTLAVAAGATADEARRVGFRHGDERARASASGSLPAESSTNAACDDRDRDDPDRDDRVRDEVLVTELDRLGFRPRLARSDDIATGPQIRIDFGACPFEHGSDELPEVACSLHEGIVAGLAGGGRPGAEVTFVRANPELGSRPVCHALVSSGARYDSTTTPEVGGPRRPRHSGKTKEH